jgi:nudix-type nucleoside diphosphatase (YffH/AdpP family)
MPQVLLAGPMAWAPLLESIIGSETTPTVVQLEGVAVPSENQAFPMPFACDGVVSDGIWITLESETDYARLCFFAAVFGAVPVPKHGVSSGRQTAGISFLSPEHRTSPSMLWNQSSWCQHWGDIVQNAAREIIGYFGRVDPGDLEWRMPMILSRAKARQMSREPHAANHRSTTHADAVTTLSSEALHEGFFLAKSMQLQHPRFDGQQSEVLHREVFVATDAVIVLPYDPIRDRVLLVEQFRMGPFGRGDPLPWVLEAPAGRIDAGESPEQAARRECEEEAGLALLHLEHVNSHYCSPGCSTEFYHCYLALADLPDSAAGYGGLATEHEDIRSHVVSFDDAMGLISSGEANIGPLVLLLLWLARERPRLRSLA